MGTVDGWGYDGQQKGTFCDAHGPCQMIQSTFKPVFLLISTDWLCLEGAQMPRCGHLAIFMTTTYRQTDRQTDNPIALPLVHARGVKIGHLIQCHVCEHEQLCICNNMCTKAFSN